MESQIELILFVLILIFDEYNNPSESYMEEEHTYDSISEELIDTGELKEKLVTIIVNIISILDKISSFDGENKFQFTDEEIYIIYICIELLNIDKYDDQFSIHPQVQFDPSNEFDPEIVNFFDSLLTNEDYKDVTYLFLYIILSSKFVNALRLLDILTQHSERGTVTGELIGGMKVPIMSIFTMFLTLVIASANMVSIPQKLGVPSRLFKIGKEIVITPVRDSVSLARDAHNVLRKVMPYYQTVGDVVTSPVTHHVFKHLPSTARFAMLFQKYGLSNLETIKSIVILAEKSHVFEGIVKDLVTQHTKLLDGFKLSLESVKNVAIKIGIKIATNVLLHKNPGSIRTYIKKKFNDFLKQKKGPNGGYNRKTYNRSKQRKTKRIRKRKTKRKHNKK